MIESITFAWLAFAPRETDTTRMVRTVGIIGGATVVVVIIRYLMTRAAKRRMLAMRAVAKQCGWMFFAEAPLTYVRGSENFPLFNQGHSKKLLNLMGGEVNGIKLSVFDYEYKTGSGRTVSTIRQTVIYLEPANLSLPYFSLRPENLLTKLGEALGAQDIDFGQRPEFSRMFVLRGLDEPAIRHTFNDRLLTLYEAQNGLSTEAGGNQIFIYRAHHEFAPAEVKTYAGLGLEIVNLLQPS